MTKARLTATRERAIRQVVQVRDSHGTLLLDLTDLLTELDAVRQELKAQAAEVARLTEEQFPQEIIAAIDHIRQLGMSGCDLDALSPEEEAALRRFLMAVSRAYYGNHAQLTPCHHESERDALAAQLAEAQQEIARLRRG